jgi:steroid delta-isomerase-like uncharacterized protein
MAAALLYAIRFAAGYTQQEENRPEEVAHAYVEAYNEHDVEKLMALYAEDARVTTPDLTVVQGKPRNREFYEAWFRSVPDVKNKITTLTLEDDRFVLELWETGTYRRRLPTLHAPRARGQKLAYPYVLIARVRNGKIISARFYENDLVLEKQLGMR